MVKSVTTAEAARSARAALGWTQAQVARGAALSVTKVARIEAGDPSVPHGDAMGLCAFLGEQCRRARVNAFGPPANRPRAFDPTDASDDERATAFGQATFGSKFDDWKTCLAHPRTDVLVIPAGAGWPHVFAGAVPVSARAVAWFVQHRGGLGYCDGGSRRFCPCFTGTVAGVAAAYEAAGLTTEVAGPRVAALFRVPDGPHPVEPSAAAAMIG
jgi:hypothetical protein